MIIQQSNFGTERIIRSGVHEGKYCYGDHIHQFCELVWVLDGEIEMTVHGKTEVAHRGEMTVITPFAVHSFNTKDYSKILIAVISDSFILGHVSRDELYTSRERSTFRLSEELSALLVAKDFIRLCTTQYQHRNDNYYLHTISSLVYMIFVEYFNTSPVVSTSATKTALSSILIYLTEHFTEDLTLESVGAALGYSPKYVSNCISALSGFNFRRLLNSLRIEYAKNLLINQRHLTVIDVAMRSGFSNERSFHRSFVDIVGTTPAKYRRSRLPD